MKTCHEDHIPKVIVEVFTTLNSDRTEYQNLKEKGLVYLHMKLSDIGFTVLEKNGSRCILLSVAKNPTVKILIFLDTDCKEFFQIK